VVGGCQPNDGFVLEGRRTTQLGPLLGLLSVTHVYEATAGFGVDGVYGSEFRVVDVTRDEVSDTIGIRSTKEID
jgi:hypothetical protein